MARTLRQLGLFIVMTLVMYSCAMLFLARVRLNGLSLLFRTASHYKAKGGFTYAKFHEFDTQAHYDVVVVGSSHAYRGYDPRIFARHGLSLFNLGTSGQTPTITDHVVHHYINGRTTRLLIFDLYESVFDQEGLESTSDITRNISSDDVAIRSAWALHDLRALNMVALRFATWDEKALPPDSTYRIGGFAERTDSVKGPVVHDHRPLQLLSLQIDHFERCLNYCKEEHIPLLLVTHYYPNASDHGRHALFHAFVDSIISGTGVRYLDLAYDHHADDRNDFYDDNHLNSSGVALFNAQLLDSLEALHLVQPH